MLGIESIVSSINKLFDSEAFRAPAKIIPGIILLCSLAKRPGLSCILSFGKVIKDLEKNGIPTGPLPDGTPNLMNKFLKSTICEMFRALKEDSNIQLMIPPGSLSIVAKGGNGGGPVTVVGSNIKFGSGNGIMQ